MQRRAEDIGAEIAYRKASAAGGTTVLIRLGDSSAESTKGPELVGIG